MWRLIKNFGPILKLVILVASSELGRETWYAVGERAETQHEHLISARNIRRYMQLQALHVTFGNVWRGEPQR